MRMGDRQEWTILKLLDWTTRHLFRKGFENPRLNTEILLGHALGMNRVDLYLNFDQPLSPKELSSFKSHLKKRLKNFPLQYITGHAQFMSHELMVNPDVSIPRPETEVLVESIVDRLKGYQDGSLVMVDLGTGCGNIAISLAKEFPGSRIYATDISPKAIAVARENAQLNGVADVIDFVIGDLFEPLRGLDLEGRVDLLVSNPPYIPQGEMDHLPAEVRLFEPPLALNGGEGGMDFHRRIIAGGPIYLKPGALLALEVGTNQARVVKSLILETGDFRTVEIIKDYAGIERVVIGEKS